MASDTSTLQTELRNPRSRNIDTVSTLQLCQIIHSEDSSVAQSISPCLPTIAAAIDSLAQFLRQGGRVLYVGAGTSGRLGVLDASEIPPTFSAPPEQSVGLIAGGDLSLRSAQEGAEDSAEGGVFDLKRARIQGNDALIGIASSGRTPYVLGCLEFAKGMGCVTVGIACVAPSAMGDSGMVDYMIEAVTGPEVVTGSTRMKAGTATKMVLNMLSTGAMIKLGKTYGNIMIDVKPRAMQGRVTSSSGLERTMGKIQTAIKNALQLSELDVTRLRITRAYCGVAGSELPALRQTQRESLQRLLPPCELNNLRISNDIQLLATVAFEEQPAAQHVTVLLSGTGSIAMRYTRSTDGPVLSGRVGGWGALLGDDGSGYDIGRRAIRLALSTIQDRALGLNKGAIDPLVKETFAFYGVQDDTTTLYDLLGPIVLSSGHESGNDDAKQRIAGCAKVVLSMADRSDAAKGIVDGALKSLAELVKPLRGEQSSGDAVLVLSGGVMRSDSFREKLVAPRGWSSVIHIDQPAVKIAKILHESRQKPS